MTHKSIALPRPASPNQPPIETLRRRGRGARSNLTGRFDQEIREDFDDGWGGLGELDAFKTEVRIEKARSIISTNQSPDINFAQSVNPYRGCEHGCIYCFARPTHCYLGLSAGLDFESILIAKSNTAERLEHELSRKTYKPRTIALGTNTDPYQPLEKKHVLTRQILEIMDRTSHPVGIVTKSALILRDIDILASLAKRGLVKVALSVTTLDRGLARRMEPRASTPERRLDAISKLNAAGIPTAAMVAPIIPAINDMEIEAILKRCAEAGAKEAAYVMLRLPLEISDLFQEWLKEEYPDRAKRVMSLVRSMHGGKDYISDWGVRQRGTGPFAELVRKRFEIAKKQFGMNELQAELRSDLFQRPRPGNKQLDLLKS